MPLARGSLPRMVTQCCSRVLFKTVAQEVVEAVGQNLVMPCPVADFALWPGAWRIGVDRPDQEATAGIAKTIPSPMPGWADRSLTLISADQGFSCEPPFDFWCLWIPSRQSPCGGNAW